MWSALASITTDDPRADGQVRDGMLVDLHAHYPMHLKPPDPVTALRLWSEHGRANLADRCDAALISLASRLWNHESATTGPRVTIERMHEGGVGVVLSVLCTPLLETGNHLTTRYRRRPPYGAPPEDRYLRVLLRQLLAVESQVQRRHLGSVRITRSPAELDEVLSTGKLALVHCVEGGFSLGASPESIARSVQVLAGRGVAYVTIAHLVWRHVATNVPCMPFMADDRYNWIFPQPEVGLTELGRAAIRSMVAEGVLVDVTHMSHAALADTFRLMDELDPSGSVPLLASHCGFRFGRREYNLTGSTVSAIAARDGVIGLMVSPYFMADGLSPRHPRTWEESFEVLCRHIDEIQMITGSHRHVAVGSDLDGFIKPTLAGLADSRRLGRLGPALEQRYGVATAEAVQSDNALRVLRAGWRGAPRQPASS
jgi:microsomal dipeptidase-like Zn-dependent dipeptidase